MSSSDDYLAQLAKMVEEAKKKQGLEPTDDSFTPEVESVVSQDSELPNINYPSSPPEVEKQDFEKENIALPQPSPPEKKDAGHKTYYSPGQMLEGKARETIELPENWENSGNAFTITRGKREALIEGVYSNEIDGPIKEKKDYRKLVIGLFVGTLVLSLPLSFILAKKNSQEANNAVVPIESTMLVNALPKKFPERARVGENINFAGLTERTSGQKITGEGFTFTPSGEVCVNSYVEASSTCFLGSLVDPDGLEFPAYYQPDIIHSAIFSSMYELEDAKVSNTKYSATTVIDFSGEPTRFLLVLLQDNAGVFIQLPIEWDPATAIEFSSYFSLESVNKK